jgi:hypothetical protein
MEKEISKFFNGDKKAEVYKAGFGYVVDLYIDNKLWHKAKADTIESAEDLAEDFIINENAGPGLLNENGN